MRRRHLDIVVLGLSLSSSWGNGHATTYRALLKAPGARGHAIAFLERGQPWYAANRDLADPGLCRLAFYRCAARAASAGARTSTRRMLVIVGSYVPEGSLSSISCSGMARGRHRLLRHRHAGDAGRAGAGRLRPISRRGRSAGYDIYLSFTGGPTLALHREIYGAPRGTRALLLRGHPSSIAPTGRAEALGPRLSRHLQRRPAADAGTPAASSPRAGCRTCASSSRGRNIRTTIDWPANVERIEHVRAGRPPRLLCRSRFTLNVTRADMVEAGMVAERAAVRGGGLRGADHLATAGPASATIFEDRRSIMLGLSHARRRCASSACATPQRIGAGGA